MSEHAQRLNNLLSVLATDRGALKLGKEAIKEIEAQLAETELGKRLATIRGQVADLRRSIDNWEAHVRVEAVLIWNIEGRADKKIHPFVTCVEQRQVVVDDPQKLLDWCRENALYLLAVDMDAVKKIADTLPAESGVRIETIPSARIATDLSSMIEV